MRRIRKHPRCCCCCLQSSDLQTFGLWATKGYVKRSSKHKLIWLMRKLGFCITKSERKRREKGFFFFFFWEVSGYGFGANGLQEWGSHVREQKKWELACCKYLTGQSLRELWFWFIVWKEEKCLRISEVDSIFSFFFSFFPKLKEN